MIRASKTRPISELIKELKLDGLEVELKPGSVLVVRPTHSNAVVTLLRAIGREPLVHIAYNDGREPVLIQLGAFGSKSKGVQ